MIEIPPHTVIPSVRSLRELSATQGCSSPAILLSNAHIGNLEALSRKLHDEGKKVLVHTDLLGGFRPDREGIKLLRNMFHVDGIFSQNAQVVSAGHKQGMWAVQRLFLMDSRSLERSVEILKESRPDGVEVLPGVLAARYAESFAGTGRPYVSIAGGMVASREEAEQLFQAGYQAITSSNPQLW